MENTRFKNPEEFVMDLYYNTQEKLEKVLKENEELKQDNELYLKVNNELAKEIKEIGDMFVIEDRNPNPADLSYFTIKIKSQSHGGGEITEDFLTNVYLDDIKNRSDRLEVILYNFIRMAQSIPSREKKERK